MNVVIVVVTFCAIAFAECVTHRIIGGWYVMYDPFLKKHLLCAVHRYSIEFFACLFLNVAVCKRAFARKKQFEDLLAASCNTELVTL